MEVQLQRCQIFCDANKDNQTLQEQSVMITCALSLSMKPCKHQFDVYEEPPWQIVQATGKNLVHQGPLTNLIIQPLTKIFTKWVVAFGLTDLLLARRQLFLEALEHAFFSGVERSLIESTADMMFLNFKNSMKTNHSSTVQIGKTKI
ncbi:uncharacterized protein LOC111330937 [Stylophora pistillata]|uniref:uncharacterized protein LOC111330937 n=1 Tax=Stylophora pistillata TaxID=50429 RepID=UPI000C052763|nr:uncharacterized protein LOC111330937 [Stylophora pistillata]